MRYRVKKKQPNSKMCLVCGLRNKSGLHAAFYEMVNGDVLARFTARDGHQGYPNRLHGGIATAILDETIGRAIMARYDNDIWGVTVEFTTRFLKPVPVGEEVRVVGRITKEGTRMYEGSGEILLRDGTAAVQGRGKYLKLPIDKIADFDKDAQEWKVTTLPDDPEEFEW
jgi:acyl-coenzyme A thioesterase PaaI-like protein